MGKNILRPHAEEDYAKELKALIRLDKKQRPKNWKLSPWAVVKYIMGGELSDGTSIEPKYFGNQRLIEIAVASLVTDRALLLVGIPGTAKTWVSEHLAAAISGDSTLLIQGTAGIAEDTLRYGWNYAKLLAEGPTEKALVPSPVVIGMKAGKMVRVEELTRIPAEVQDTLITILSEKTLPIPELSQEVQAVQGFNIIATANTKDKGINELSSALQRRFNVVTMPLPATIKEELDIVQQRVDKIGKTLELPSIKDSEEEVRKLITIFRELRKGVTEDQTQKVKSPSSTLSPAEAISVVSNGLALATHFGDGQLNAEDLAAGLVGAVIKDPVQDKIIWQEYLETVVKDRKEWASIYKACKSLL